MRLFSILVSALWFICPNYMYTSVMLFHLFGKTVSLSVIISRPKGEISQANNVWLIQIVATNTCGHVNAPSGEGQGPSVTDTQRYYDRGNSHHQCDMNSSNPAENHHASLMVDNHSKISYPNISYSISWARTNYPVVCLILLLQIYNAIVFGLSDIFSTSSKVSVCSMW